MQQEMVEGGCRVGPEDIFDRLPIFERDQVSGAGGRIVCIPGQIGKQCCIQVPVQEGLRKEECYQFEASISGVDCLLLGARGKQVECIVPRPQIEPQAEDRVGGCLPGKHKICLQGQVYHHVGDSCRPMAGPDVTEPQILVDLYISTIYR